MPVCYMQTGENSIVNLSKLCGKLPANNSASPESNAQPPRLEIPKGSSEFPPIPVVDERFPPLSVGDEKFPSIPPGDESEPMGL